MSFDLSEIVHHMGPFALAIAGVLVLMGVASSAVLLERLWGLRRSVAASRRFAPLAKAHLDREDYVGLAALARAPDHQRTPLAGLFRRALEVFAHAGSRPARALSPIEVTRRELARAMETVQADARRGLGVLASVGSVAPFVGLLGTVVGIITAFASIAAEGSGGLGVVSAGISEALVETALGLLVAIPAVLAFNALSTRIDAFMLAVEQAQGELLDHLESGGPAVMEKVIRAEASLAVEPRVAAAAPEVRPSAA